MNPCNCPATRCPRHGDCTACRAFHREKGDATYCAQMAGAAEDKSLFATAWRHFKAFLSLLCPS